MAASFKKDIIDIYHMHNSWQRVVIVVLAVLMLVSAHKLPVWVRRSVEKPVVCTYNAMRYQVNPSAENLMRQFYALKEMDCSAVTSCLEPVFNTPLQELEEGNDVIRSNYPVCGEELQVIVLSYCLSTFANQNDIDSYQKAMQQYLPLISLGARTSSLFLFWEYYKTDFVYENRDRIVETLKQLCAQETNPLVQAEYYHMLAAYYDSVFVADAEKTAEYRMKLQALYEEGLITYEAYTSIKDAHSLTRGMWYYGMHNHEEYL